MAIKFFRTHEDGKKELDITKKICRNRARGLAKLEDWGISFAEEFYNQFFIVYKYIPNTLKDINDAMKFDIRDTIQIGI